MSDWKKVSENPIPTDKKIIGIVSNTYNEKEYCSWICLGIKCGEDAIETCHGVIVWGITWWHECPVAPIFEDDHWYSEGEEWICCKEYPPPSFDRNSIEIILFDKNEGITQAEYWGCYQTDVHSCKYYYEKPICWMPFPRLPMDSHNVLQI